MAHPWLRLYGILRLKEHISIIHVRQQHSIPEIEVIREVLFVLSNMLNNLEEESLSGMLKWKD